MEEIKKPIAIVVEDQPVLWDYIKSCLDDYYEIKAFCTNTKEAELAFREYKPNLVWLDCYLGEISDFYQGIKNSGLQLATWIKNHNSKTKIFLFTASTEVGILNWAYQLNIEGIALGGKFIKDKTIIQDGIKAVSQGAKWVSPNIVEDVELGELGNITVFEFCVMSSLLLGKSNIQIAEDLDATRKRVNNSVYRVKQKLGLNEDSNKEELLEIFKDKIQGSVDPSKFYNLSEIISINALVQDCLNPIMNKIKTGELTKVKIHKLEYNETK